MHAWDHDAQVLDRDRKVCQALSATVALDGFVNLFLPQIYISAVKPNKNIN